MFTPAADLPAPENKLSACPSVFTCALTPPALRAQSTAPLMCNPCPGHGIPCVPPLQTPPRSNETEVFCIRRFRGVTGGFAACAASPLPVLIKFHFEGDHSTRVQVLSSAGAAHTP